MATFTLTNKTNQGFPISWYDNTMALQSYLLGALQKITITGTLTTETQRLVKNGTLLVNVPSSPGVQSPPTPQQIQEMFLAGTWAPGLQYMKGWVVFYSSAYWLVLQTHVSQTGDTPDLATSNYSPFTGQTFNSFLSTLASQGNVNVGTQVSGVLHIANGGFGTGTGITGLVKGSGSAYSGAVAGTDYLDKNTAVSGNTLYVDAVNGNNSTALRGKAFSPFLTIAAAVAAASAGDTVHVKPGTYAEQGVAPSIALNFHFDNGVVVQPGTGGYFIDDTARAVNVSISGSGEFNGAGGFVTLSKSSSVVVAHVKRIQSSNSHLINLNTGTLFLEVDEDIYASLGNAQACVWWADGPCHVRAKLISSQDGDYPAILIEANSVTTPTGQLYIVADEITATSTGADSAGCIVSQGDGTAQRAWISAQQIHCGGPAGNAIYASSAKVYVQCLKLLGTTQSLSSVSELYLTSQKVNGPITLSAGTNIIDVGVMDDTGMSGVDTFTLSGGVNHIEYKRVVRTVAGRGLNISGGTNNLKGDLMSTTSASNVSLITGGSTRMLKGVLDSSAAASGFTILLNSGALALAGMILKTGTGGAAKSISTSGTVTVKILGPCSATTDVASGVTLSPNAGFLIDTGVS